VHSSVTLEYRRHVRLSFENSSQSSGTILKNPRTSAAAAAAAAPKTVLVAILATNRPVVSCDQSWSLVSSWQQMRPSVSATNSTLLSEHVDRSLVSVRAVTDDPSVPTMTARVSRPLQYFLLLVTFFSVRLLFIHWLIKSQSPRSKPSGVA